MIGSTLKHTYSGKAQARFSIPVHIFLLSPPRRCPPIQVQICADKATNRYRLLTYIWSGSQDVTALIDSGIEVGMSLLVQIPVPITTLLPAPISTDNRTNADGMTMLYINRYRGLRLSRLNWTRYQYRSGANIIVIGADLVQI